MDLDLIEKVINVVFVDEVVMLFFRRRYWM